MITSKDDYRYYVKSDFTRSKKKKLGFLQYLFYSENFYLQKYLSLLRRLEYLSNTNKNILDHILYYLVLWKYKKYGAILMISIPVNVAGPGLVIPHPGLVFVHPNARIGKNCCLLPGVLIGQKDGPDTVPTLGDDVYVGPGAKILGKITIGNNVTIGPNSVVMFNVPDNCVVLGVPARIINRKSIDYSTR